MSGFPSLGSLLTSRLLPEDLGAVLVLGACATLSLAQGALGDVLVPGLGVGERPGPKGAPAQALCSPSVLRAARALAFDTRSTEVGLTNPDSEFRIRFGDVLIGDRVAATQAAAVLDTSSRLNYIATNDLTRMADDLARAGTGFGFVLGVADLIDASRPKGESRLAIRRAVSVAVALAQAVGVGEHDSNRAQSAEYLLPWLTIPSGATLARLHAADRDPLAATATSNRVEGHGSDPVYFGATNSAAISRALTPGVLSGGQAIPADFFSTRVLTVFEVQRALRVVDLTSASARVGGMVHRARDQRGLVLRPRWNDRILEAAFDGFLFPDYYALRSGSDGVALFQSALRDLRVRATSAIDSGSVDVQTLLTQLGMHG